MKKRWKLAACWTLIASLSTQMVIPGFAGVNMQETVSTVYKAGLCEHHPEHDEDCGYGHEHDEECYTEVLNCVHEHEEDCYLDDDLTEEEEATPSDADERETENCPHICDEESSCITWVLDCPYDQDESNMGTCGYVCDICEEELATDSNAPQMIISAEYVQELIDALPDAEDINDENADEVIEQLEAIDDAKLLLTEEELELLDFTKYEAAAAALGTVYEVATLADAVRVGDFKITTDGIQGTDYTYESGVLTIETSTPVTIENADPDTATADRIVVKKDVSADITLAGVNIDVSATDEISAFEIERDSAGDVKITLADGTSNELKAGWGAAVLQKEGINGSLTIQCEDSGEENHICTDACGELQVNGEGYGTGIGSRSTSYSGSGAVSDITIAGGVVTVNVENATTGIGSGIGDRGSSGAVSDITISGGVVTVNGGDFTTGIGSGESTFGGSGAVSDITISGGAVTINGGKYTTGIGSGYAQQSDSGTVSDIMISGGVVTASVGSDGTGIGSGNIYGNGTSGAVSDITITGGSVLTTSIGCTPDNGNSENVYLLTLANPNSETVYIDGEEYVPVNHLAADENNTNLYAYLTGESHTVQIGNVRTQYEYDSQTGAFVPSSSITFGLKVTGGIEGTDYTYENGVLTIETSTPVTIENADSDTATADRIVVKKDVSADITLAGVNIDVSATDEISAFEIETDSAGDVKIILADGTSNQFKVGNYAAALQKEGTNGSLTIQCEHSDEENHICTDVCGKLQISIEDVGTGIGSGGCFVGKSRKVSNIAIIGGRVTINSNGKSTGIGSGCTLHDKSGVVSDITITGSVVAINLGVDSTGIGSGYSGGGYSGAVSDITITGSVVAINLEADSTGIGSGFGDYADSGMVSDIMISGGVVTASVGSNGVGIGSGNAYMGTSGAVSDITIIGGSVLTTSIGCTPDNGNGENVYLLTLANSNSETVYIDGEKYVPVNHLAADENDTNLYVYLTGEAHKVKIGGKVIHYHFAENAFVEGTFSDSYSKDETGHWHECADGLCEIKTESENHDFSSNGKCSKCDYDGAAPTGEISIGSRKWNQFLSEPAFEVFFKEHQTVTITASDNSGDTVAIGYLLSNQKRTEEELKAADFSAYVEPFTVSLDQYIIYAKLTDSTGNATYINTDGIVLDQTAPVISGVKNGSIYCGAQTVTINDTNLESVTVNDADMKLDTNGQFQLLPAESAQKIAAVDKAGNRTEISVTVNNGHTPKADDGDCTTAVLCQYCDEIAVAAKEHDFSDEWKCDEYEHWHECMNEGCTVVHEKGAHSGTATCTSKVVCEDCGEEHGNINPSNHSSLQHEKAVKPTKSKEGHIEYWYCIGCGNYYSDKALTHEISLEDTVIDCLDEDDGSETSGILNIVNRIFADVAETDAYYNDILFVYNNSLMSGSGAGFFTPNGSVTGLQIAEILYQMEGRPAVTEADRMAAGHSNNGYGPGMTAMYDAVVWAQKAGLDIAANQQMTREQLVLTLYRYAQYKGYDVSVGENTNILSYQDFAQISEEIIPAVQWAVGMGILKDNGTGILNPKGIVTRAQLAGVIHDFIIKYDLVSAVSESGMIIWVKKKNEINL